MESGLPDVVDAVAVAGAPSTHCGTGNGDRPVLRAVLIIGAGLIGTSIGLALREVGVDVALEDTALGRLALAVELGAGRQREPDERFDVAVLAVPPSAVAAELMRVQQLGISRTFTDVASVKAKPQAEAEALGADMSCFVGGHPVAGRERSGPAAAHPDLFAGRPWVLTPSAEASRTSLADARALAVACGALPVEMTAEDHDAALATVSHLPHLVAALLAAQLEGADDPTVNLGGTGLHDTTRIAAGEATLWTQILASNASHLATALAAFSRDVDATVDTLRRLDRGDAEAVRQLTAVLRRGNIGRARVPGKRGAPAAGFVTVPVIVRDAPGELADLLRTLAEAGINIEDVRVEHEPGRPLGVVELDVRDDLVQTLVACVRASGRQVYQ